MLHVVDATSLVPAYLGYSTTRRQQGIRHLRSQGTGTSRKLLRQYSHPGPVPQIRINTDSPLNLVRAFRFESRVFLLGGMKGSKSQEIRASYREFLAKEKHASSRPRRRGVTVRASGDGSDSKRLAEWREGGGEGMPDRLWDTLVMVNESVSDSCL